MINLILLLSVILLCISGICSAAMDIISFKYEQSIFSKLPRQYWYQPISSDNKRKFENKPGFINKIRHFLRMHVTTGFFDGWHLSKLIYQLTLFISLLCIGFCALTIYDLIMYYFIARYIVFGSVFTLFINKIFLLKQ